MSHTVPDPDHFCEMRGGIGIYSVLTNPQTLKIIVSLYSDSDLPKTKLELYERAYEWLTMRSKRGRDRGVCPHDSASAHGGHTTTESY